MLSCFICVTFVGGFVNGFGVFNARLEMLILRSGVIKHVMNSNFLFVYGRAISLGWSGLT